MAGARPAASINRPASLASPTPCSLSGTSCQPVNRFSRFQVLWPCRSKTSVPSSLAMAVHRRGHLDDLRKLLRDEAGSTDQAPVAKRQLDIPLDVARVDAAAVQHAHLPRCACADQLAYGTADKPHRLVCVLGLGVLAGTNGPHRLIRDDEAGGVVGRAIRKPGLHLRGDDLVSFA